MKLLRQLANRAGIFGELLRFLWKRKLWWIVPMALVLIVFAVLLIVAQSTPLGAFIYAIF